MSELTPITRIESYLDAIVNSGTPPLEDITRIETFLQAIYDNQVCALTPITRIEMFLGKISGQNIVLPEPITRIELYLAAIAGEDVELPENPITRIEMYLADWADSGDWTTISGAIVEFIAQRAHKLKSCVVSLSPQQDLSHGDPSPTNICPISGWDGVTVWDFGKNLFNDAAVVARNNLNFSNGIYSNTRADTRAFNFVVQALNGSSQVASSSTIIISTAGRYSVTIDITTEPTQLRIKHNGATVDYVIQYPFTLKGKFVISIDVLSADTSTIGGLSFKDVMIELGTTATEYEQFNNDSASYSVTFEEMVMGGEIDCVSGQGKSERNNAVFDGTETFIAYGNLYVCSKTFPKGTGNYSNFLCSHASVSLYVNYANASKNTFQFTSTYFGVSTVEEFKAFLAEQNENGTPVTINYPLDTSTEFETAPTPITALKGYNAMWSDGGDIEVTVHGTPVELSTQQALNMLLGGAYHNNQTAEDVSDDEALDIILGGENK